MTCPVKALMDESLSKTKRWYWYIKSSPIEKFFKLCDSLKEFPRARANFTKFLSFKEK